MDAPTFFGRLNAVMKDNPPSSADAAAMKRFAAIGITPGKPFNLREFDLAVVEGLQQSVGAGQAKIAAEAQKSLGKNVNGWDVTTNLGRYGTNYIFRAVVARLGLGANLPEDAIYPRATRMPTASPWWARTGTWFNSRKASCPPSVRFGR